MTHRGTLHTTDERVSTRDKKEPLEIDANKNRADLIDAWRNAKAIARKLESV